MLEAALCHHPNFSNGWNQLRHGALMWFSHSGDFLDGASGGSAGCRNFLNVVKNGTAKSFIVAASRRMGDPIKGFLPESVEGQSRGHRFGSVDGFLVGEKQL
jgi:hypothetical protein